MKFRDIPQSGSRGKIVASRNRSGPYHRARVSPDQPATAAQCGTWINMRALSRLWNLLQEEQRLACEELSEAVQSRPSLGTSGRLSGCLLFKKLNLVLVTCHRQPLLDPPPLPQFSTNPVNGFEIRQVRTRIALILKVSGKLPWQDRPPLEDIMVQSWAPCHPGTRKNDLYSFLGFPPAPVGEESDFTDLYLKKLKEWRKMEDKRYQVPLEGSKIFVRVVQQINGWQNELGRFQASALVPVNPHLRARELAALLRRWPAAHR